MDIICFSSDHWDEPLWTNKQHTMFRLAKLGHRILYVDPPTGMATLWRYRSVRTYKEKRWLHWTRPRMRNLWVHSALGFPFSRLLDVNRFFNPRLRLFTLKRVMKTLRFSLPVLWIYHPNDVFFVEHLGEKLVLYDCVDEIAALAVDRRQRQIIQKNEIQLLEIANLVFASSQPLYEARKKANPNTYLVENVADYDHFSKAQKNGPIPLDIATIHRPIVGFVGAIRGQKVDLQLLVEVARSHPEWSLVMIGPVYGADTVRKLSALPNIYMLGYKEYETLPNYLRAFDICMIPYRTDNEYIHNVFPMKFFEFLATGKPVVTTNLASLEKYRDVASITSSSEEFIKKIKDNVANGQSRTIARMQIELAKKNSWAKRIEKILQLIEQQK